MTPDESRDEKTGRTHWDAWFAVFKWNKKVAVALLVVAVLGLGAWRFDAVFSFLGLNKNAEPETPTSVTPPRAPTNPALRAAFFFVDPNGNSSAAHDGVVQREGFEMGVREHTNDRGQRRVSQFAFAYSPGDARAHQAVLAEIKRLYQEERTRVFVVTMSEVVSPLAAEFRLWRKTIRNPRERPVLIGTVASTTTGKIADADNGTLRLYVRSSEESAELAKYAAWSLRSKRAAIVYISDRYGDGGKTLLESELQRAGIPVTFSKGVSDTSSFSVLTTELKRWIARGANERSAVFVVAYGGVLSKIISASRTANQAVPILATSTVTHERWRPTGVPLVTAVPRRASGRQEIASRDFDVVRLFSRITIERALECADRATNTEEFVRMWLDRDGCGNALKNAGLVVSFLSDGDARVELDIIRVPQ